MKKIINRKSYDTSTAKEIAGWDNGLSWNDFGFAVETLYLKKTGEYFLHGVGGGKSGYGEWYGNTVGPGEKILPFSEEEAREWAEKLDSDEYERVFGKVAEEANTITLRTTTSTKEKFDKLKEEKGITASELLQYLLDQI